MKTKHWPRSSYMYAHTYAHKHPCTPCMMSPAQGYKSIRHTHPHSHYDNIHTTYDTWDRNSILTSYNQWNIKTKRKKKDHCEAKRWTVNSELLRGRSKHIGEFVYILVCYSAAVDPSSHASQLFLPTLPPFKSTHLLLSSGFFLSSLGSPWGHNGLSKTISGMRNRCENS